MKLLRALFVLALVVGFSVPAFAETQNVKVSGSLDAYWFYRDNYDLRKGNDAGAIPVLGTVPGTSHSGDINHRSNGDDYFRSNTQIEVSADLTDNVSTVINIVNQRDWNASGFEDGSSVGDSRTSISGAEFDIVLDLAYVQMKEIFYSPLTLTIGRQDLWFGRGFIVGNNNRAWDPQGATQADEYSVQTAFDAIRATLDFNPWTLDFVYSKIVENSHDPEDDIDLYVANVNYKFAEYNAVAEGYLVTEIDRSTINTLTTAGGLNSAPSTVSSGSNDTYTVGGRVQFDPISQITLGGELAYQFGNYRAAAGSTPKRDRSAWAADIFGTYRWDYTWKPEITAEYVLFSGEENLSNTSGDYGAWNGLYRGKFWTAYADFREFVYATGDPVDQSATTNEQFIQVKAAIKPLDDLLLEAAFTYLWNDQDVHNTPGNQASSVRDNEIGYEIDLQATYDYTEDVSFGFLAGWFVPGDFYDAAPDTGASDARSNATALDLVSSVKVTF